MFHGRVLQISQPFNLLDPRAEMRTLAAHCGDADGAGCLGVRRPDRRGPAWWSNGPSGPASIEPEHRGEELPYERLFRLTLHDDIDAYHDG